MDADQLLEAVFKGNASIQDVEAWIKVNKAAFERPSLKDLASLGRSEGDRLIDAYSDWEIRAQSLGRAASHASKKVFELDKNDPASGVTLAKALCLLSRLLHNPQADAMAAFQLGYTLWKLGSYFDASEALAEAAEGFRQAKADPLMELSSLSYLSDCLLEDKRFDDTFRVSGQLRERATAHGYAGFIVLATFDSGKALKNLGKGDEALEYLKQALDGRKVLSEDAATEQSVPDLEVFLDAYGQAARQFGRFEEALAIFQELAELQSQAGEVALQARAISDIGYTYLQAGEKERAVHYLIQASDLAASAGDMTNAARWRNQAELMCGKNTVASTAPCAQATVSHSDSAENVYALNVQLQRLLTSQHYDDAIKLGQHVLEWAQLQRDTHLEINIRNTLGLSYMSMDDKAEAVRQFHKGIQLADSTGDARASMSLRYNLAKAYIQARDYQASHDVLLMGIGYCQQLLGKLDASEFRQEVVAGSLSLYELLVLLLSQADHQANHIGILAMTETIRCQNLLRWLRADYLLESTSASEDIVASARGQIQTMREVEIELEVRHLARKIVVAEMNRLRERRVQAEIRADALFDQLGFADRGWRRNRDFQPYDEVEEALQEVLEPRSALVCLFSIPEGISPIVIYRHGEEIKTLGRHIPWDRNDRRDAFARWTGNAAFRQGLGRLSLGEITPRSTAEAKARFDGFFDKVRKNLIEVIVALLEQIRPEKLTIVPHAELALVPYWQLADLCTSVNCISVAPSLSALRVCLARKRPLRGATVVVPDLSNTLANARKEIDFVIQARGDGPIYARTVDELQRASERCSLLHVAAHGLFNVNNPYHSGFLAGQQETEEGLFVQYVDLASHQLSNRPTQGAIRLMTVAECMTKLSLRQCRLAVLSTCESGIPRQHGGGELTGLPNALLVAGAKSVIASLWEVNDAATAMLMRYLYETWNGGAGSEASPARALAAARDRLRHVSREEVERALGHGVPLPPGDTPFNHARFSDAFQCFGSW
ncbi:MAG: CHAT domain-containing protein [Methanothrix sp.]|nr:CHAT domain-containing protein [Methanothrix sp.]